MVNEKLLKLQELIKVTHDSLTRKEFEDNFKLVIDIVNKLKAQHKEAVDSIDTKYLLKIEELLGNLRAESWSVLERTNKEVMDYCMAEMEKMKLEIQDKLDSVESGKDGLDADPEEVAELAAEKLEEMIPEIEEIAKDLPKLGTEIRNGLELLPDGQKLSIDAIQDLKDELERLREEIRSAGGNRNALSGGLGVRLDSIFSQTGTISSLTTLSTLHTIHTVLSFAINGQAQHLTADYTFSGNTITYTTALDSEFTGVNYTLTYV